MEDHNWVTEKEDVVWTFRERILWKTTDSYWVEKDGGEMFVHEQRHRLMPWRTRRQYITYDEQMVTG